MSDAPIALPTINIDTLTNDPETWVGSSLLSVSQITPMGLNLLHEVACRMRSLVKRQQQRRCGRDNINGDDDDCSEDGDERITRHFKHCILSSIFYEASTRTSCSFQAAMYRLGGNVIHVDASTTGNTSASQKGESLADTIRCMQSYTDVTVVRHPVMGSIQQALTKINRNVSHISKNDCAMQKKPIINAGDGIGEHPTQALLDLFTIRDEFFSSANVNNNNNNNSNLQLFKNDPCKTSIIIVMLGDLKHGRTVHSLAKLLCHCNIFHKITLRYCSPRKPNLGMPQYVQDYVSLHSSSCSASSSASKANATTTVIEQEEIHDIKQAIRDANVLYVTRIQKERFENLGEYEAVKDTHVINKQLLDNCCCYCYNNNDNNNNQKMIIMHPLPRGNEIDVDIDNHPYCAYFRQMENGLYVRMAILALLLGHVPTT